MKRLAKILATVLAVVIVLVIVAAIVLPFVIDPNDYKAEITAQIEQKIGRDVTIPGEIELSVFPWLGISIGKVTVANAPGFGDKPLAEIASAEVRVKLLPLLQRQIQIGTVALDGLRLRLAQNAQGQTNWGGIVEHLSSEEKAAASDKKPAKQEPVNENQGGGFELTSLEIGSVAIQDAAISWHDAVTGDSYKLSDFHLITGALAEDQPFDVEVGATLAAASQGMTGTVSMSATIQPDMSAGVYRFTDLQAQLQAKGDAVPGKSQTVTLSTHGFFNLTAGKMELKDLNIQVAGLDISGDVSGKQLNQSPALSGSLSVAQFDPRAVLDNLGMAVPELQGDDVLNSAKLDVQFNASSNSAEISQLRFALDDSVFTGSAKVSGFTTPAITFDADVNSFNLDHYLPVASAQQTSEQDTSQSGSDQGGATTEIDLSFLNTLTLDGKLHVGQLVAYDMTFNDATLAIGVHDGVLTIKPLASGFYDGSINIVARVDASSDVPQYSLQANLNSLKFAPLLKDLVGTDLVSALANMKLDLTSSGSTVNAIKQALDGTISFDLSNGTFHGFNLARLVAVARNQLTGGGTTLADGSKTTPFSHLGGTFNINNGVLSGDGLDLDTKYLGAIGQGQYNLLANNLDYHLKIQVDEKNAGPLSEIAGLIVPIHLTGSLLSPQYSIDVEAALKALAQQHLQDEKAELQQKLQEKLSDELGGKTGDKTGGELEKKLQEGLSDLFN